MTSPSPEMPRCALVRHPLACLLAAQAAWLIAVRQLAGVGWGWAAVPQSDGQLGVGWLTNASDSFFYSSWLEQARSGHMPMDILYSTTTHPAAYVNPVLWLPGFLSRTVGGDPAGWLNLGGFIAALACTAVLYRIARQIGLSHNAALWGGLIAAFGSGWSWFSLILARLVPVPPIRGADLRFLDLLPSSSALVYPYHTIGLLLVALLWWTTLRLEQSSAPTSAPGAPAHRATWHWVMLVALAALLASSRPYEPVAFLLAYGCYTAWPGLRRDTRDVFLTRLRIWVAIAAGCLPFVAYAAWLATQPVWRQFSHYALALHHPRAFWIVGFGGLWLLALAGARWLWRAPSLAGQFPAWWVGLLALLLVVGNFPQTKLAAAGGLAIALAAGVALDRMTTAIRTQMGTWKAAVASGVLVFGLAGPGGALAVAREAILFPPRVDAALFELGRRVRPALHHSVPTVLCEHAAGEILPGIAGVRVVAGHWALTDNDEAKQRWLAAAGLEEDATATPAVQFGYLQELVDSQHCDFLILRSARPVATLVAATARFEPLAAAGGWRLYRIRPPTRRADMSP